MNLRTRSRRNTRRIALKLVPLPTIEPPSILTLVQQVDPLPVIR